MGVKALEWPLFILYTVSQHMSTWVFSGFSSFPQPLKKLACKSIFDFLLPLRVSECVSVCTWCPAPDPPQP